MSLLFDSICGCVVCESGKKSLLKLFFLRGHELY